MRDKLLAALDQYVEGLPIKRAIVVVGLTTQKFYKALSDSPELKALYSVAKEVRAEGFADEVITIADDAGIAPLRARNQIDARKWYAAKANPKVYGDRIDLTLEHRVDLVAAIAEGAARALPSPQRHLGKTVDAEYEVISAPQPAGATDKQSGAAAQPAPFDPFAD